MRTSFGALLLAGTSLLLLSACGEVATMTPSLVPTATSTVTALPVITITPPAGKIAMVEYTSTGTPFSFSYPQSWDFNQPSDTHVEIFSPETTARKQKDESDPTIGDGNPLWPDVAISYYPTVAEEVDNTTQNLGAKSLTELLQKDTNLTVVGDTTLDGLPAKVVTISGVSTGYGVYVEKGTGLYTILFNYKDSEGALSAEERSILLSLKLLQ